MLRLKKETEIIKKKIIRDIKKVIKEEDDYYKSIEVSNFWNSKYIEYENNDDKDKTI